MYRDDIQYWKRYAREQLNTNAAQFERAIVREIAYLRQKYDAYSLEDIKKAIQEHMKVPAGQKVVINEIVNKAQDEIKSIWDSKFAEMGIYENVKAYQKVNFAQLREDHRETLTRELREAIRRDFNYPQFRQRLLKKQITNHHARTLANTAVAQYDNAYMHEVSAQAGIKKFKYDGMKPERTFCKKHYLNVYTKEEIKQMDNGQGLPVMTAMGGYNCVHYWTPVWDDFEEQKQPVMKERG